jgi:hypothetical protein
MLIAQTQTHHQTTATIRMRTLASAVLMLLLLATNAIASQHGIGAWLGIDAAARVNKKVRLSLGTEARLSGYAAKSDRQNIDAGLSCRLFKWLDASAGYRLAAEQHPRRGTEFSNRLSADMRFAANTQRLRMRMRFRYQAKWEKLYIPANYYKPEHTLRAKLSAGYRIYASRFTPNCSAELYLPVADPSQKPDFSRVRATAGTAIQLSKNWSAGIDYLFQTNIYSLNSGYEHILAVSFSYRL